MVCKDSTGKSYNTDFSYCDASNPRRALVCTESGGWVDSGATGCTDGSCIFNMVKTSIPNGVFVCDCGDYKCATCSNGTMINPVVATPASGCRTPTTGLNCTTPEGYHIVDGNESCTLLPTGQKCYKCANGVLTKSDPISLDCEYNGNTIKNGSYYCDTSRNVKIMCANSYKTEASGCGGGNPVNNCHTPDGGTTANGSIYCDTAANKQYLCSNTVLTANGRACTVKAPVGTLSATPVTGTAPMSVKFTMSAPGAVTQLLNFGDGEKSDLSLVTTLSHTYKVAGEYTASFICSNSDKVVSTPVTQTITVSAGNVDPTCSPTCTGSTPKCVNGTCVARSSTTCDGMERNNEFDVTCILEEENKMLLYGAVGVVGAIILIAVLKQ